MQKVKTNSPCTDLIQEIENIEFIGKDQIIIKRNKDKFIDKLEKGIDTLIEIAKNNGNCITYQNIDECIPQDLADVIDSEFLEKIYEEIESKGIKILENSEEFDDSEEETVLKDDYKEDFRILI